MLPSMLDAPGEQKLVKGDCPVCVRTCASVYTHTHVRIGIVPVVQPTIELNSGTLGRKRCSLISLVCGMLLECILVPTVE